MRHGRTIVIAALFLGACSGDTPAAGCRFDTDCGAEQLCMAEACVPITRYLCVDGGDEVPRARLSPLVVDFGVIDEQAKTEVITIENTGGCILVISKGEIRGDARFSCDDCTNFPVDVAPERSTTFRVTVAPGAAGAAEANLVLTTNDLDQRELLVPLRVASEGQSLMRVSPTSVDFGYVPVGDTKELVVQAINDTDGSAQLEIVNAYLDPSDGPFTMTTAPAVPATIAAARVDPNARMVLTARYAPTADDEHTADLRVVPRVGPPVVVPLVGRRDPPVMTVSPLSIDFGDVPVGMARAGRVAVQNSGPVPLEARHSFASLGAGGEIVTPRGLPNALRPGAVFELDVLYTPTRAGPANDTITINSNDPAARSVMVQITGNGIASGSDVVRIEMNFDNDSDSPLDVDLRDVDLILESPVGEVCTKAIPNPAWGMFGRPTWTATGAKENPERILLPDAMADGRFVVSVSYVEDCATLPTALTASLLGIGTDALVDYLTDGETPIDPNDVAEAVQTACADRRATNVTLDVFVNGAPVGQRTTRLAQKGELIQGLAIVRQNGFFSVE